MPQKANHRTDRQSIVHLEQIINIGPATSTDLKRMGILSPQQLIGRDPLEMYQQICHLDQQFYDPCVLDVFMATVDYMNGNRPQTWWSYTTERKTCYGGDVAMLRSEYRREVR